jgi:serine/threonine protein phosphatase PrpC
LDNCDILQTIWGFKKKGNTFQNMHSLSANIVDSVIKYSLVKLSADNVTCIFIAFKNSKDKMLDEDFEYINDKNSECKYIGNEIDLS